MVLWPMCCHIEMPCRRHRTPPRHSIQTRNQSVAVLSIDVKRHTGIHSYPFQCLGWDLTGKSFRDLPHTPANAQFDAVMVVNSRKLSRKYRTNRVSNPGPVVCESSTISTRPQRLSLRALNTHLSIFFNDNA